MFMGEPYDKRSLIFDFCFPQVYKNQKLRRTRMAIPKEVAQFLKEEKEKIEYYNKIGMNEETIRIICLFDRRQFYKNYEFNVKVSSFSTFVNDNTTDNSIEYIDNLFLNQLSKEDDISTISRYRWVETLQDERLIRGVNDLLPEELEILTLVEIEGYKEKDLVGLLGKSYSTIKRKYTKIKNKIKCKKM